LEGDRPRRQSAPPDVLRFAQDDVKTKSQTANTVIRFCDEAKNPQDPVLNNGTGALSHKNHVLAGDSAEAIGKKISQRGSDYEADDVTVGHAETN
jgi:hypothetical protein